MQQIEAGTTVQVINNYTAMKEDEITVSKGEEVLVMEVSHNALLVHREANQSSPAAEGWIPAAVAAQPKEESSESSRSEQLGGYA